MSTVMFTQSLEQVYLTSDEIYATGLFAVIIPESFCKTALQNLTIPLNLFNPIWPTVSSGWTYE